MESWVDGELGGMESWVGGELGGWRVGWMERWMDAWRVGWMESWMDGWSWVGGWRVGWRDAILPGALQFASRETRESAAIVTHPISSLLVSCPLPLKRNNKQTRFC